MPTEVCTECKLDHPPLVECIDAMRRAMAQLLLKNGGIDRCDCGQTIYWLRNLNGNKVPYTSAGLVHFVDCTGKFAKRAGGS